MTESCLILEVKPQDITKAKDLILPIIERADPKEYFYLYYGPIFKVGMLNLSEELMKKDLEKMKSSDDIESFSFRTDEIWDISKIIACASRKITEYLIRKVNPMTVEGLVNELVSLPEINAESYSPLHFVLNQLRMLDKETEIRFLLKTNPNYLKGYKQVGNIVLR